MTRRRTRRARRANPVPAVSVGWLLGGVALATVGVAVLATRSAQAVAPPPPPAVPGVTPRPPVPGFNPPARQPAGLSAASFGAFTSSPAVGTLQRQLNAVGGLGGNTIRVDGTWGPATATLLAFYVTSRDLDATLTPGATGLDVASAKIERATSPGLARTVAAVIAGAARELDREAGGG